MNVSTCSKPVDENYIFNQTCSHGEAFHWNQRPPETRLLSSVGGGLQCSIAYRLRLVDGLSLINADCNDSHITTLKMHSIQLLYRGSSSPISLVA